MTFTLGTPSRPAPKAETLAWAAQARRALMQRSAGRSLLLSSEGTIGGFRSLPASGETLIRTARI